MLFSTRRPRRAARWLVGARVLLPLAAACVASSRRGSPPPSSPSAGLPVSGSAPPPAAQNPSPMVERTRAHGRVAPHPLDTRLVRIAGLLPREVELHLPPKIDVARPVPLLVHFLGPAYLAVDAARAADPGMAVAVVNLSPGTGAYERPLRDGATWPALLDSVRAAAGRLTGTAMSLGPVYLSAFSAGNGAVRAILGADTAHQVRGVAILDGIHTSYVPERRVLADSGTLDPAPLQALLRFAERAAAGDVRMLVTHSEVFPGTFASTTETADWLLDRLALRRTPTLTWGPHGMQQTSMAQRGSFTLLGFAGNSAPDHLDHLHAMVAWVRGIVAAPPGAGGGSR